MSRRLFTSESVTEGHPDKICDQISDGVLDALLAKDPNSRVACETCTTTGMIMVMGEITTEAYVDVEKIVRETLTEIGYTRAKYGFDSETCSVLTAIHGQSPTSHWALTILWKTKQARTTANLIQVPAIRA